MTLYQPPRHFWPWLTILGLFFVVLVLPSRFAAGQEPSPASVSAPKAAENNPNAASAHEGAQEAPEASGDETAEFKESASVKFLARITGLDLKQAYWLSVLLNFAIISGLIIWVSRSKLPGMFRERTQTIQRAMQEAKQASEEARGKLAEVEARLARIGDEIAAMRSSAEQEAVAEEARLKAAADEDARRIILAAEQEITAAAKAARRELTAYAADLAVSLAKKQIFVDSATDRTLVRSFSDQLSATGPNEAPQKPGKDRT